ncbi:MAG: ABC transporter ATP-binding protein [Candidatus Thermoplasmatota archaeon]|nr:ABC transporter ATP-binding protein [Candidatus Thermoplasmatota archaeon]
MSIDGSPGERKELTCPNCQIHGFVTFPETPTTTPTGDAIVVKHLTKYYGKIKGIEDLTFSVKKGEIFGFLGPNGAGKTTTIRTLLGYLYPTSGEAYILGKTIKDHIVEIKGNVGYIPGDLNLYGHLTGGQFLHYFDSLRNKELSLLPELLQIFEVPLERKIKGYSRGMKQKLGIIQAFMDDPEIVIMDEPTSGLDPLLQQKFYEFLRSQKKKGKTIFFSSHVLSEVDKICDRIGIIRNGRLVALEDVDTLKEKMGKFFRVKIKENPELFPGPKNKKIIDGRIEFVTSADLDYWVKQLSHFTVQDLEIHAFSLEDIFIHYYEGQT